MAITTNREYLTTLLSRFGMTEDDIELIMVDNKQLEGYLDVNACKLAVYNNLSAILPTANISEGGFSQSWDVEKIKLWYNSLCVELKKPNAMKPRIRNRSNYW